MQQTSLSNKALVAKARKERIIEIYNNDNLTLGKIGKMFGITVERVRQIVNPSARYYCKIHKRTYQHSCDYCKVSKVYPHYLRTLSKVELEKEIKKLQKYDRRHQTVLERVYMLKYLHDEKYYTIEEIAETLKRDISTIKYLYRKFNE